MGPIGSYGVLWGPMGPCPKGLHPGPHWGVVSTEMRAFCGAQSPPGAAPGAGRRQPDIDNPQCARGKQQNQIKTLNRYLCGPIFFLKPFFWHLQIIDLAPLDLLGPRPPPLIYGPLFLNLWEVRNNKITMTQPSCFPHPQSKIQQEGGLFREKPYAPVPAGGFASRFSAHTRKWEAA